MKFTFFSLVYILYTFLSIDFWLDLKIINKATLRQQNLLDIKNDILKSLNTRVVIPLVRDLKGIQVLTKEFIINDEKLYWFFDLWVLEIRIILL